MPSPTENVERASQAIVDLLARRRDGASICPSEAARALAAGDDFRPYMEVVRVAARSLVDSGQLEVLQHGHVVELDAVRGPVRFRPAQPGPAPPPPPPQR